MNKAFNKKVKLVCGVGINDADYPVRIRSHIKQDGTFLDEWRCPFYTKWQKMLSRCYGKYNKSQKFNSYDQVEVCQEWLRFSNFKSWMEKQDWESKELDKDLLSGESKIYSPETCCFISHR